jgi:hypothetical protein
VRASAGGTQHHEPPEVAWALPEVEVGVELEVMPLELVELEEEEPVLVEPVEDDPVLVEPVEDDPVLVDPVEDDEPVEVRLVAASAVCVDPGRTKATAPAATTLATPTEAVTTRIRARPRVLAVTASAIGSGCELELVMSFSLEPGARSPLQATSELPMNRERVEMRSTAGFGPAGISQVVVRRVICAGSSSRANGRVIRPVVPAVNVVRVTYRPWLREHTTIFGGSSSTRQ